MNYPRLSVKDFDPEVLRLFDKFVHGEIDRDQFLTKVARFAKEESTPELLLESLRPKFEEARQVESTDDRINAEFIEFESPQGHGKAKALLVRPAISYSKLPCVLVIHENRGLNPHIEDIARRIALEGFIAFAPDALFSLGGYSGDEDRARELFSSLDRTKTIEDFVSGYEWLQDFKESNGRVGALGFCFGGGVASLLATRLPELAASVSYYGSAPPVKDVHKINTPLMLHFAEIDERINLTWGPFKDELDKNLQRYEAYFYEGVYHGFNNNTTPRFDEFSSRLSWHQTIGFLHEHLVT